MSFEISSMFIAINVTLADLLLLFIYHEVLAMVGMYLKSGKPPVRMPLYIAMVALARCWFLLNLSSLFDMLMPGYHMMKRKMADELLKVEEGQLAIFNLNISLSKL